MMDAIVLARRRAAMEAVATAARSGRSVVPGVCFGAGARGGRNPFGAPSPPRHEDPGFLRVLGELQGRRTAEVARRQREEAAAAAVGVGANWAASITARDGNLFPSPNPPPSSLAGQLGVDNWRVIQEAVARCYR